MPKINSPVMFDLTQKDGSVLRINKGENDVDKDVANHPAVKVICGDVVVYPANEAENQSPEVKKDVTDPEKLAADAAAAAAGDPTKSVQTKG